MVASWPCVSFFRAKIGGAVEKEKETSLLHLQLVLCIDNLEIHYLQNNFKIYHFLFGFILYFSNAAYLKVNSSPWLIFTLFPP